MQYRMIVMISLILVLMLGVTGCMGKNAKADKMIRYVEEKYGESFEIEEFDNGSTLFADLYGGDKLLAHPAGMEDRPFLIYDNSPDYPYSDDYVQASLSCEFTDIHKSEIEQMDSSRERAVKLSFLGTNTPEDFSPATLSAETFNLDLNYDARIYVDVAVNTEPGYGVQEDTEFLFNLYNYMKKITERDFIILVAYIKPDRFEDAKEIIRVTHAVNLSWSLLEDGVQQKIQFERQENIQDASYFSRISR